MRKPKSEYVVPAVANALRVLESFSGDQEVLGVTDLSRQLDLPKNNVFRLLATLEYRVDAVGMQRLDRAHLFRLIPRSPRPASVGWAEPAS